MTDETQAPASDAAATPTEAPQAEAPKTEAAPEPKAEEKQQDTGLVLKTRDGQELSYDYGEYAGMGSADLPTSGFLPFLTLLAPQSGAVTEGDEKFIEGAKAGMFLLSGENRLFDGKKGLIFVPIHDEHLILEKTSLKKGGKVVAEHDGNPSGEVATALRAKYGNNRKAWRSEQGNIMVERHNVTGVLFESVEDVMNQRPLAAAIIPFERSKMRAYSRMADGFNKYPPGKRPPLFALMVHLTSHFDPGDGDGFWNFVIKFPVQDDFARSLISPRSDIWAEWAKQCSSVAKAIVAGALKGDANAEVEEENGEGTDDIPF